MEIRHAELMEIWRAELFEFLSWKYAILNWSDFFHEHNIQCWIACQWISSWKYVVPSLWKYNVPKWRKYAVSNFLYFFYHWWKYTCQISWMSSIEITVWCISSMTTCVNCSDLSDANKNISENIFSTCKCIIFPLLFPHQHKKYSERFLDSPNTLIGCFDNVLIWDKQTHNGDWERGSFFVSLSTTLGCLWKSLTSCFGLVRSCVRFPKSGKNRDEDPPRLRYFIAQYSL